MTNSNIWSKTIDNSYSYCCSTAAYRVDYPIILVGEKEKKRMVTCYRVAIIDREKEEFLDTQYVMGESSGAAMLNVELTDEMRKLKKQDKLAILTNDIGSFEKYEINEVRIRNDD